MVDPIDVLLSPRGELPWSLVTHAYSQLVESGKYVEPLDEATKAARIAERKRTRLLRERRKAADEAHRARAVEQALAGAQAAAEARQQEAREGGYTPRGAWLEKMSEEEIERLPTKPGECPHCKTPLLRTTLANGVPVRQCPFSGCPHRKLGQPFCVHVAKQPLATAAKQPVATVYFHFYPRTD